MFKLVLRILSVFIFIGSFTYMARQGFLKRYCLRQKIKSLNLRLADQVSRQLFKVWLYIEVVLAVVHTGDILSRSRDL